MIDLRDNFSGQDKIIVGLLTIRPTISLKRGLVVGGICVCSASQTRSQRKVTSKPNARLRSKLEHNNRTCRLLRFAFNTIKQYVINCSLFYRS